MATKKCPKCGEENPVEAVMCWACYTPLAGGANAAARGGMVAPRGGAPAVTPAATAAKDDEEKSGIDPKIFLVAGLLFGAIIIGGFTTGLFGSFGGGSEDTGLPTVDPPTGGGSRPSGPPSNPGSGSGGNTNVVVRDTGSSTTGPSSAGLVVKHYNVMAAPNPNYVTGTLGILATQPNIGPVQAGELARIAKNDFAPNGKWTKMQVVVFNNQAAAKSFQKYQAQRQNVALSVSQFQDLASNNVWGSVPAYLEATGNRVNIVYPSQNPNSWWHGR